MPPRKLKIDNITKDLQSKILFLFIPNNKLRYQKNKIPSNKCSFCNLQIDSIKHSLWDCLIIRGFWTDVFDMLNKVNLTHYIPSLGMTTFGILDDDCPCINIFILQVKINLQAVRTIGLNLSVASLFLYFTRKIVINDPYTEKIVNFIRTREDDFRFPFYEWENFLKRWMLWKCTYENCSTVCILFEIFSYLHINYENHVHVIFKKINLLWFYYNQGPSKKKCSLQQP